MKRNIAPRGLLAAALLGTFGAASAQTATAPHCASIQSTKPEVCIPDWTTRSPSFTGTAGVPGAATTIVVPPAASSTSTTGILSGATVSSDTNTTLDARSTTPRNPTPGAAPKSGSTNLTVNPSTTASGRTMNSSPSSSIYSASPSAPTGSNASSSSTSGGFFRPSDTPSLNGTASGTPTPGPAGTATPGSVANPDTSSITGTMPR